MRVRSVTYTRQRKKKHLRRAKGSYATKKNRWRMVKQHLKKSYQHAYRGRRIRKIEFRRLWISRINAASRELGGLSYSQLMNGLKRANIQINRKVLADLAVQDPAAFTELANAAKSAPTAGT